MLCLLTYVVVMARRAPSIVIGSQQRQTMEAMVRSPTSAHRGVLRGRIVLLAAQGQRNDQIQQPWESPSRWSSSGGAVMPSPV